MDQEASVAFFSPVFSVGEHQGVHYYAMQYIDGRGLDRVLCQVKRLRNAPGAARAGRQDLAAEVAEHPQSGDDQRIHVWDTANHQMQTVLDGHTSNGIGVAFTHGGELLLSWSWDGTTRIWDPVIGRELLRMPAQYLTLRSDDRQMAVWKDGQLELWELAGQREYRTLYHGLFCNRKDRPHDWGPRCVSFSQDGRFLAWASLDGVRLWDIAAHKSITGSKIKATLQSRPVPGPHSLGAKLAFPEGDDAAADRGEPCWVVEEGESNFPESRGIVAINAMDAVRQDNVLADRPGCS
jgi:hypothetical protein